MRTRAIDRLFRPTKAESKADSTTRIAKGIIEEETSARRAKTMKLRTARLERNAAEKARIAENPQKKPRKTSPAKARAQS